MEPMCTATSMARPWSGNVVKCENKIKCPDELTGKNSVIPWRADKNNKCKFSKFILFLVLCQMRCKFFF